MESKLLEYNPKAKWHEKIDNANLRRETVLVGVYSKELRCEVCNELKEYLWDMPEISNIDGNGLRICSSCLALYDRFMKYSDETMTSILQA